MRNEKGERRKEKGERRNRKEKEKGEGEGEGEATDKISLTIYEVLVAIVKNAVTFYEMTIAINQIVTIDEVLSTNDDVAEPIN